MDLGLIILNVISKDCKIRKKFTLRQFSHFSMKIIQEGTNELSKDGFD